MASERFDVAQLREFAEAVLRAVGSPEAEAELVAYSLVEADARGLESHGLLRLPLYVATIDAGGIVPGAEMRWVHEQGAGGTLDAAFGFGHTAMKLATDRAADLAGVHGCSVIGVRRSTHFGMGAPWVERLAERELIGITLSNSGPFMAPYGSAERLLGTNPVSVSVPVPDRPPLILDMATSAGAYGRIVAAASRGEEIPEGWAVDEEGRPVTDARAALDGALQPFGAHKGSGLAIVVELLAAALPGALLSHQITDMWIDRASRMGTGHLAIAIDPVSVSGPGEFASRVTEFVTRMAAAKPAVGHATVRLPGDVERDRSLAAQRDGVQLSERTVQDLIDTGRRLGVEGLVMA